MAFLFGILIFVATIFITMVTHELGHYLMARRFGIVADDFSIGVGKKAIFSFTKGKTKVSLRPIPIGAFCDFEDRPGGLCDLSAGKRIAVFLAGPLTNIFSGMVLFVVAGALHGISPLRMIGNYFVSGFTTVGQGLLMLGRVFSPETYSSLRTNGVISGVLLNYHGTQAVSLVLMVMAMIMFIIGLSNLFPIPSFDGGQIFFALPELFGKKMKQKTVDRVNKIAFISITAFSLIILAEVVLGLLYGSFS